MWRGSSFQLWMIEHGGKKLWNQCICWQKVTCQLFVNEKDMNLSLMEAKGALLEDVSEFVPQHYRFWSRSVEILKNHLLPSRINWSHWENVSSKATGNFSFIFRVVRISLVEILMEKVAAESGCWEHRNRMPRSKSRQASTKKESKTDNHCFCIQDLHRTP